MNTLAALPLREFLAAVAAPTPTPGGGAVAALAAACGTALAEMVATLPRTRHNAPEDRVALDQVLAPIKVLRARLETLADLDSESFDRLMAGLRLPKGTDDENAARRAAINDATKDAALVPLETVRVCADVLKLMETVAGAGNRAAGSDLFVGIGLVRAAAEGAAANVRANLETLADPAFTFSATRRLTSALDDVMRSAHAACGALQGGNTSG